MSRVSSEPATADVAGNVRALPGVFTTQAREYARCLAWSRDGSRIALGDAAGALHVFDASGQVLGEVDAHRGSVQSVAFGDGVLVSGGADGKVVVRDLVGAPIRVLPGTGPTASGDGTRSAPWIEQVTFDARGERFASAAGRVVRIWTKEGEPLLESEPHASTVTAIAFGGKGDQLASACYGGVHLWDVARRKQARHLPFKGSLLSLALSPDGKVVACGSQDCSVHFWRLTTGLDSEMQGYPFKPRALAWDARGGLLATSGDKNVTLWDFAGKGPEGTSPISLVSHQAQVVELAFHPRRCVLASAANDAGVILWEPRTSKKPVRYAFLEDQPSGLSWSPDGTRLAAIDASGRLTVWRVDG